MTYDPYARLLLDRFHGRWGEKARIWCPDKVVLVADHFLDLDQSRHRALQSALQELAERHAIEHYYPLGASNHGVCHALLPEEGLVRPGELIAGTDSHSCHYGGFGAIGLGVGVDAMEGIFALGQYWLQMPPVVQIRIEGRFARDVYAKDVILQLAADLANEKGLLGTAVELDGSAVQALHPEEKLTLANMAVELGARWLIIPANDVVCDWVSALTQTAFEAVVPDVDADYDHNYEYRAEQFVPVVALPGAPDDVVPVAQLKPKQIDEVYVGSCTGAKEFDVRCFMDRLLEYGQVAESVTTYLVPSTRKVKTALESNSKWYKFIRNNNIQIAQQPGCNACFGGHGYLAGNQVTRLSTSNRNYHGRMGSITSRVYLGSPALAARVAASGRLGDGAL